MVTDGVRRGTHDRDDDAAVPHGWQRAAGCSARSGAQGDAGARGDVRARAGVGADRDLYRASAMLGVPTMLIAMLEHPDLPGHRTCPVCEAICSGGSTVPARLVRRLESGGRAVHHRVRSDRVLTGGSDDPSERHDRRQGRTTRPADAERGGQDRRPRYGRPCQSVKSESICTRGYHVDARLLRDAGGNREDHRWRRLAAHRRSLLDGRARLLQDRGPPEGHDHPRRREHLSAGDRGAAVPAPERRRGRGGRPARRPPG